ncbi:hypothetical protein [Dapis sp. BLCC M229]|uniref:hypothetical protein n=1 Tax=Dapis sp. BLCC M229 TaxID=3400188 RepID=UPI003CF43D4D
MVVLHGNGEDIYFLISPTLPISHTPHLPRLPVLPLPLLCTTTPKIIPDFQPFAQLPRQDKAVNEELRNFILGFKRPI